MILLSARAGEEAQVEGLDAGADDYLVKPFAARELLARVRSNLELARIRREAAEQIREEARRLELLNRTGTAIAAELDLERLVQAVTDAAVELTGARFGAFFYNAPDETASRIRCMRCPALLPWPSPSSGAARHRRCSIRHSEPGDRAVGRHHARPALRQGKPLTAGLPGHLPLRSYLAVPWCRARGRCWADCSSAIPAPTSSLSAMN